VLRASGLDWTIVYPVALTHGARSGRYRAGERLALNGLPRISRADVAEFLLAQAGDATYLRKGVLLASA
jgi:putative NADH-flavin reductase